MATRKRPAEPPPQDSSHLAVQGPLTIYTAAEWKQRLAAALAETDALELDMSAATEIDGAGLQLLIMAKHEAARQGKDLRIAGHTPQLLEILDLCQLAGFFGDPLIISPPAA